MIVQTRVGYEACFNMRNANLDSKEIDMNEIQFILYSLPDEEGKVQVVIKDETMWATKVLHEYIQKGFVMDDDRLKQAKTKRQKRNTASLTQPSR